MIFLRKHLAVRIFLVICIAAILVSAVSYLADREGALYSFFFNRFRDNHMDFFNSVRDNATKDVYRYETGSIYPPLINIMYHWISKLYPDITNYRAIEISFTERGKIIYYTIHLLGVALCLWGCWLNTKKLAVWERISLLLVILLSAPMLYVIERGNSVIYAVALILLFLYTVSLPDDRKVLHEFGLILLAVSANMKFYPALFGLILIKKKRYWETVRCVLYGVILFVGPLLYYGGKEVIINLITSVRLTTGGLAGGVGYKIGWYTFDEIIRRTINFPLPVDIDSFMTALVLGGMLICGSDSMFNFGCALICVGYPWFSSNYNATYMFIPICFCLSEAVSLETRKRDHRFEYLWMILISVLLAMTIIPLFIGGEAPFSEISILYDGEWQQLNINTLVCCTSITILGVVYFIEAILDHDRMKERRLSTAAYE